jgi:hypothetical protein
MEIRARHKTIAKLAAMGYTRTQIAWEMEMTPERVGQLLNFPAMENLIAFYQSDPELIDKRSTSIDRFISLGKKASERVAELCIDILDQVQSDPVPHSAKIVRIGEFMADRVGLGKHVTNHNIQHDFSTQLDMAIAASNKAKVIEAVVERAGSPTLSPVLGGDRVVPQLSPPTNSGEGAKGEKLVHVEQASPPIKRRA